MEKIELKMNKQHIYSTSHGIITHFIFWITMNKKLLNIAFNVVLIIGLTSYIAYTKGWILTNFESVSAEQAQQMIQSDSDSIILDVRTSEEFEQGHLQNAVSIPLGNLEQELSQLSKDQKVIVYCQSGSRSVAASRLLSAQGYTPLNLKGGINAWSEAGYTISH